MDRLRRLREQVERQHPKRRFTDKHRHKMADIPDPREHPWKYRYLKYRWRLALAIVTHPVIVALTVALVVVSVPMIQLVGVSANLRKQADKGERTSAAVTVLVKRIQVERKNTVGVFCGAINRNIRASHQLTAYLKALVVSGAKQSQAFEDLYRQHGFPPYLVRLKTAERQANRIVSFSGAPLKCVALRRKIESQTPPPPPAPLH